MSKKSPTTVRPSPVLQGYIDDRGRGATASLNDLFDRFQVLRNALAVKLTEEEKQVIRLMLQEVALNDSQFVIACMALPQDIWDEEFIGLPGAVNLADKLQLLTTAQLVATVDSLGY